MKILVTIRGPVGAMKTPIADRIQRAINKMRPDLSCVVFDHELFAFRDGFEADFLLMKQAALRGKHDVSVIVIGTGTGSKSLSIEVEPALPGVSIIFNAVTDYLTEIEEHAEYD